MLKKFNYMEAMHQGAWKFLGQENLSILMQKLDEVFLYLHISKLHTVL